MDEPAGSGIAPDATSSQNHGLLYRLDAETAWVPGKVNRAIEIKGNNAGVIVMRSSSLDAVKNALTVTAWVRRTNANPGWRAVVARQLGADWQDFFFFGIRDNRPVLSGERIGEVTAPQAIAANEWVHVAATYDGTATRLFVNGNEVAAGGRAGGTVGPTAAPVTIGANQNDALGSLGDVFQGQIDEVRLYDRALPAADIAPLAR
jgi:hypothetical protein